MSTRANIGIKLDNGQYKLIYSHYDGYPQHVGKVLTSYYDSYEKALELLEGTSIRSFYQDGSLERFNDGEAETYDTIEDALKGIDYVYVFVEKWRCYHRYNSPMFPIEERDIYIYV